MDPWGILSAVVAFAAGGGLVMLLARRAALSVEPVAGPAMRAPELVPPPSMGQALAEFAELRGELSAVRAEWKAHQKQLDAYLEAFEDLEESVERRRRRAVSARSKAEAREAEQQIELPPREAARLRARALGFKV